MFKRSIFLVAALVLSFNAQASQIPYETTGFITGVKGINTPITVESAGEYDATLSDLSFGKLKFDYLSMSISSATTNLASLENHGKLSLNLAPGLYFLNIFGVGGGTYNTGLYGVAVNHAPVIANTLSTSAAPVPVPAAGWLLLSGLTALGWKARKK